MKTKTQFIRTLAAVGLLAGLCTGLQTLRAEDAPAAVTTTNQQVQATNNDQTLPAGTAPVAEAVKLPFVIYDGGGSANNHYSPSGMAGGKVDESCTNNPHSGNTCLRCDYTMPAELDTNGIWHGVIWMDPPNDWGDQPGGYNLTGAKKLSFWVRGEKGGETVNFKFGIIAEGAKFHDSATGETGDLPLTTEWTEHSIDLTGASLTRIKTGFVWMLAPQSPSVTFYLDDIRYE